jgi:outer membrane protein
MNDRGIAAAALLALGLAAAAAAADDSGPLTVRVAVERALARDPMLLAAGSAAEEASAGVQMARSAFRPWFLLTSTPGVTTGLPLTVAGEPPAAAGARLRLTLWDAGLKEDEALAFGRSALSAGRLESARRETIRRTVAACARLWASERRVESAQRRLAARETLHARTVALGREGRVTELDVERSGLDLARARHVLLAAETGRALAAADLRVATGLPESADPVLAEDPLRALPDAAGGDAVPAAIASDPELRALGEEAGAASRAADLADRWFRPMVIAEARYLYVPPYYNYDQYYLKVDTNTASAGVSVVVPVLTGGLDTARAAQARAKEGRVKEQRRARENDVARAARTAAAEADLAGRELELARKGLAVAREALRVAEARAREGRGEPDGVPRAELEMADAEDGVSRAAEALAGARLALLSLRGEIGVLAPPAPPAR